MSRPKLESKFKSDLKDTLEAMFPGCLITKNDTDYLQGIPDMLILFEDKWAVLEVKRERPTSESDFEPNQPWYLEMLNNMSFAACVYPENLEEVLSALQHAFQPRRTSRVSKRQ